MAKLKDLARIIRSKNSGPYEITFDIMFPDRKSYELVRDSGVLTKELLCSLYHIDESSVKAMMFFEPALAFKFTILRPGKGLQGSVGEHDTYGTQQHVPLLDIEVPQ